MSNNETQKKQTTAPYFDNAEIMTLPIKDISVGDRIGLYWEPKALALGQIILAEGQNTPITVKATANAAKPYKLIAGLHRLRGMQLSGLKEILAIEVVNRDADEIKLIEASENMHRRDFGPIERSMFIRSIADVYEKRFEDVNEGMSAQQTGAKKRWLNIKNNITAKGEAIANAHSEYAADTMSALYGWQDYVAEEVGMTSRSLRRYLLIYREIVSIVDAETIKKLASHHIGKQLKAMLELCKVTNPETRRRLIEYIAKRPGLASVQEAKIEAKIIEVSAKAPANGQTKYMNNALSNFERLNPQYQSDYVAEITERMKPDTLKSLRDAIDARLAKLDSKTGGQND